MAKLRISLLLFLVGLSALPGCILVERVEFTPLEEEELPPPPPTPSIPQLRLPVNNSYRSASQLRPVFQWDASAWNGPDTIRYELQFSSDRSFSTATQIVQTTGLSHQPTNDLDISSRPPVGERYFWRVRACVAEACSNYSLTWVVNVGRTERDLNGDGFADVALVGGGRYFSSPSNANGRLYVFLGGAGSQFNNLVDTLIQGSGETWFRSVAAIGDFNGDGFSDLAARVTKQDRSSPRVQLYFGGPGFGLDTSPDVTFTQGGAAAAAGDINGDGYDDLYVYDGGPKIILGGSMEEMALPSGFNDWQTAGDLNGDGYGDLTARATNGVAIFFGGPSLYLKTEEDALLRGRVTGDGFGTSISTGGDINGDGCADILIGASNDATGGELAGRAYAYLGQRGETFDIYPDGVFTGQAGEALGVNVAIVGDLNGDGFDDIGIRLAEISYSIPLRGRFLIHLGRQGTAVDTTTDRELAGEPATSLFGQRVGAGDVNGDGVDDLMIGAPIYTSGGGTHGRAYVFMGTPGQPIEPNPDGFLTGTTDNEYFGDIAAGNTNELDFF